MKTADDRHFRVEREEREKEESFPPHPLYKEQKEQRREFSVSAASRENFRQECLKYVGMVNEERLTDFFYYWSETDRQGRMRFERQKYWDTESRLRRWMRNQFSKEIAAAALRLEKAKTVKARQAADTARQQAATAERDDANEQLFRTIEENKKNAVSYEEWQAQKRAKNGTEE